MSVPALISFAALEQTIILCELSRNIAAFHSIGPC